MGAKRRVWLALAIGCGSKPFPWMNDSGFWVICGMAGLTEGETLKTTSMTIAVEGVVGSPVVMVMSRLFPLLPARVGTEDIRPRMDTGFGRTVRVRSQRKDGL